jgi:hypothetical protein
VLEIENTLQGIRERMRTRMMDLKEYIVRDQREKTCYGKPKGGFLVSKLVLPKESIWALD